MHNEKILNREFDRQWELQHSFQGHNNPLRRAVCHQGYESTSKNSLERSPVAPEVQTSQHHNDPGFLAK